MQDSKEYVSPDKRPADSMSCVSTGGNEEPNTSASPACDANIGISAVFAPSAEEDIMARSDIINSSSTEKTRETASQPISDFQERLQPESTKVPEKPKVGQNIEARLRESTNKLTRNFDAKNPKEEAKPERLERVKLVERPARAQLKQPADPVFELPLPVIFRRLCRVSSVLDRTINYFKMRSKLLIFEDLKASVESTTQSYTLSPSPIIEDLA